MSVAVRWSAILALTCVVGCTPYTARLTVGPDAEQSYPLSKVDEELAGDAIGTTLQNRGFAIDPALLQLKQASRDSSEFDDVVLASFYLPLHTPPHQRIRIFLLRAKGSGIVSVVIRVYDHPPGAAFVTAIESALQHALAEVLPGRAVAISH